MKRPIFVFIFIGLVILILRLESINKNSHVFDLRVGEKVNFEGIIVDEPDERENSVRLIVEESKTKTKILVTVARYSHFKYGDKVALTGKLQKPENFAGSNGREFNYKAFLAKDDIYYELFFPHVSLKSSGNGSKLVAILFKIKAEFIERIQAVIPEPESALLGGILLGAKHGLSKDLQTEFNRAGVIHIVVLSGYNVAIVAQFIVFIFSFLPKFIAIGFGSVGIISFAVLTGGAASTVRASVMAVLVLVAKASGRTYDVTRALFVAGFAMVIYNPRILLSDPGFQLSFMATFGLIFVSPIVQDKIKFFQKLPEKFQIRELVVSSITTQIFLLPFLLYQTGNLSLVALPANFLILSFIPITMLTGFAAALIAFLNTTIALPFAFVPYLLLKYELSVVHFFSSFSYAAVTIHTFSFYIVIFVYLVYVGFIYRFNRNKKENIENK